jgi:glycosyltransferase involved in cell wall biosynthesis
MLRAAAEAQRFIVVIPTYHAEKWIGGNIQTLKQQTHTNFRCLIGDDLSTDNSVAAAREAIGDDPRFTLTRNSQKKFALGTAHALIEASGAAPDDVVVIIDGDDRLAHPDVLRRLAETYARGDCWLTYGSYSIDGVNPDRMCRPYPPWVTRLNLFRRVKWRGVHVRTFKYALWRHIPPSQFTITQREIDATRRRALLLGKWRSWAAWGRIALPALLDQDGRFTRRCCDRALFLPLIELAGTRARFLQEILYAYNLYDRELNFGEKAVHQKWYMRLIRETIARKPRLKPLTDLRAG